MWKYIVLFFKMGFPLLNFNRKCKYYARHKDKYSFAERYHYVHEFALRFEKVIQKNIVIENQDIINKEHGGRIYIANHQSMDDIITLLSLSKKPLIFISKIENQKKFLIGNACRAIDTYFIDRNDARQSLKVLKEAAMKAKNENCDLVLFPEGTRSKDLHVHEFKSALNNLTFQAKVEVVRVALGNTIQTLKWGKYKPYPVYVKVFEPLSYDYYLEHKNDFIKICQETIAQQVELFLKENTL